MENDKNKKLWQKRAEIKGDYLDEIKKLWKSEYISLKIYNQLRYQYENANDENKKEMNDNYIYILGSYRNGVHLLKNIHLSTEKIKLNVQFFFWLTIINMAIAVIYFLLLK